MKVVYLSLSIPVSSFIWKLYDPNKPYSVGDIFRAQLQTHSNRGFNYRLDKPRETLPVICSGILPPPSAGLYDGRPRAQR